MRLLIRHAFALILLAITAAPAAAAETQVAVAANFTEPAKAIAAAFTRATGHQAVLSFGSSGAFYTQIAHGAPFEVFLSADADRPRQAEQEGLGVTGSRFSYAIGRLVLYSAKPGVAVKGGAVLKDGSFEKIAIADPATAPYGVAAMQTIGALGVKAAAAPKIVKGTSITQAYQFVSTGAADLGFVALSQVTGVAGGSRWIVPDRLHAPIDQQAILLKTGQQNSAALAFMAFLKSRQALSIIRHYGYASR